MSPRARQVLVLSATVSALLVLAFLYRFNALGGALGGFDNDHFHYYVRAKQVAHGERPLRDFYDHGLQGAWPSLSYELPALAQRIGGETLLTEAVFTIGAIAVSLGVTFLVAARLTGVVPALVVSLITLFLGTRLYGFSKVLVLAVAAAPSACLRAAPGPRQGCDARRVVRGCLSFPSRFRPVRGYGRDCRHRRFRVDATVAPCVQPTRRVCRRDDVAAGRSLVLDSTQHRGLYLTCELT